MFTPSKWISTITVNFWVLCSTIIFEIINLICHFISSVSHSAQGSGGFSFQDYYVYFLEKGILEATVQSLYSEMDTL